MTFGRTYCKASRLPIEEGDRCIVIPLGFSMQYDFNKWNKADISMFIDLYQIVDVPQEAIYRGNVDVIEYLDKGYVNASLHQLYMLIHASFYDQVIQEANRPGNWLFRNCGDWGLSKVLSPLREQVWKLRRDHQSSLQAKYVTGKITQVEFQSEFGKPFPTPDAMRYVCHLVNLMEKMDITITPTVRNVDLGGDTHILFERMVKNAAQNKVENVE
jgi:hypothetical protein